MSDGRAPVGSTRRLLIGGVAALLALAACTDRGSTEALCDAVADNGELATMFQGFDPANATAALERLRAARVVLGDLRDDAPDEVADEIDVEIDYVQALIDALEDVPDADATVASTTVQAVTDDHPEVADAAATLEEFARTSC